MMRVRQLISQLCYPELVSGGIIPDLAPHTPDLPNKRYPPWLYQRSKSLPETFSEFGLFIEEIIATAILNGSINYPEIWSRVCSSPPPPELESSKNFFGGIIGTFLPVFKGHTVEHGPTLSCGNVQGHPDLLCRSFGDETVGSHRQTWLLDVKTTTGFKKMAEESYLQILAYSALLRADGLKSNYVGLLLPIQRQILWFNLDGWDHTRYLDVLQREALWVSSDQEMLHPSYLQGCIEEGAIFSQTLLGTVGRRLFSKVAGAHVSKQNLIEYSRESAGRPLQVFLGNPRARGVISMQDVARISEEIPEGTSIFVHAPYIINLATEQSDPIDGHWGIDRLCSELIATRKLKGKGVVVHVGKHKGTNLADALNQMERSIHRVLEVSSPQTPLLLETPAGEGTELCSSIEQFMSFYQRFKGTPNFKITVDTAHIFAAGYDPAWYLNQWLEKFPGSVALVHFNDSEVPRGSRVDLHYSPGLGFIGYKRMWECHQLCVKHGIPMVRE